MRQREDGGPSELSEIRGSGSYEKTQNYATEGLIEQAAKHTAPYMWMRSTEPRGTLEPCG